MRIILKLTLPLLVLILFVGIYVIKVETWQLKRTANGLEREIARIEREISLLRAEQSFLSRPERIEKLARKHLKMRPPTPRQIIVPGN